MNISLSRLNVVARYPNWARDSLSQISSIHAPDHANASILYSSGMSDSSADGTPDNDADDPGFLLGGNWKNSDVATQLLMMF